MDELTFQDLALLEKIDEDTVVEKFGSRINSSFFDAANMLGTLKQKGYIDFKSSFPGPSEVFLTEKGKGVMALAREKGAQELDQLDEIILKKIADGFKEPRHIQDRINLRGSDLAFHLNRIVAQGYASYVFRSGRIEFSLTEDGYKKAGYPTPASEEELAKESEEAAEIMGMAAKPMPAAVEQLPVPPGPQKAAMKLDRDAMRKAKMAYYLGFMPKYLLTGLLVLIIIALGVYYFLFLKR